MLDGAGVVTLEAPAAPHQPAQHLPTCLPASGRDAAWRCRPWTKRPSAGQFCAGPKHLHQHPSVIAATASCWPCSSSFSATDSQLCWWNRTESSKTETHKYSRLISDEGARAIHCSKESLFNKWCQNDWIATWKVISRHRAKCKMQNCKTTDKIMGKI